MSEEQHAEVPHEPAPPEPRFRIPPADQVARGIALGTLALAAGWLGFSALRIRWYLAPATAALGVVSLLSAWAAAIHLTGGEKFDDHPFV